MINGAILMSLERCLFFYYSFLIPMLSNEINIYYVTLMSDIIGGKIGGKTISICEVPFKKVGNSH